MQKGKDENPQMGFESLSTQKRERLQLLFEIFDILTLEEQKNFTKSSLKLHQDCGETSVKIGVVKQI